MAGLNPENFFDNTGGGSGAPSASIKNVNDGVIGEIVDQFMTEAKKFGTDEVERDRKTGEPIEQLVIVLQTDLRNWQGVAKIPAVDHTLPLNQQVPKPPSEDDGKRAVYVKPFTNIHAAIGKAVEEATGRKGPVLNGGRLGVKVVRLEDTGKGNPLKHHAAVYTAPTASSQFFDASKTQGGPGDASVQAPPAQDPWSGQPAAAPQQQAPAPAAPAQDPWAAPAAAPAPAAPAQDPWGAPTNDEPPF